MPLAWERRARRRRRAAALAPTPAACTADKILLRLSEQTGSLSLLAFAQVCKREGRHKERTERRGAEVSKTHGGSAAAAAGGCVAAPGGASQDVAPVAAFL